MAYDKIIIGAGLYGLYSALFCGKKGEKVLVLECDDEPFGRATYINQARVHMGYHYPRSLSTALKSKKYFDKFYKEFGYSFLTSFDQIYATSSHYSWTSGSEFKLFCSNANIKCEEIGVSKFFNEGYCDGAFLTEEYTYDAKVICERMILGISKLDNVDIIYGFRINSIEKRGDFYVINNDERFATHFLLNATYASVNQILSLLGFEKFKIKYELCEIILCRVSENLKNYGLTVMDGPFFSVMPFGKTGYHSLTSVCFTPHTTCYDDLPSFPCQSKSNGYCSKMHLGNCNNCPSKPKSAWGTMYKLFKKYVKNEYDIEYVKSLFSMKPILRASEIDDSRPTVIKVFSKHPTFISVLSGKINTVYDLEEYLKNGE